MNDCEKYLEMMSSIVDNELEESDVSELMAHICVCSDCRKIYEAFSSLSAELNNMVSVPEELRSAVMKNISEPKKTGHRQNYKRYLAAAACVALICAAGFKAGLFGNLSTETPAPLADVVESKAASEKRNIQSQNSAPEPSPIPDQPFSSQNADSAVPKAAVSHPPLFTASQAVPAPSDSSEESAGFAAGSTGADSESLLYVNNTVKSSENGKSLGFAEEPDSTPLIISDETLVAELLSYLEYGEEASKPDSSPMVFIELTDSSVITLWDDGEIITCALGDVAFHPSGDAETIRTLIENLI